MTIPLARTSLTEQQRRMAAAENLFDLFRSMQALPGAELIEREDLCFHWASPLNPMFRSVWRPRLSPETADRVIEETLAWYAARNTPLIFWFIDDEAQPVDLAERLQAHGFVPFEVDAPCMVADLQQLDSRLLEQTPEGFRLERVSDAAGLRAFHQGFVAAYELPDWAGKSWEDATTLLGIGDAPWQMYVGWLDDQPVATNILVLGGGVAGLFGVGTLASARRQGIGSAITLKPLLDGRDAGMRYGALFSSELGKPVYERVGFVDTGATISRYLWMDPRVSFADLG